MSDQKDQSASPHYPETGEPNTEMINLKQKYSFTI